VRTDGLVTGARARCAGLLLAALALAACGDRDTDALEASGAEGAVAESAAASGDGPQQAVRPEATEAWPEAAYSIPGTAWTREDWEIFQRTIRTAAEEGLDTLPLGEAVAEMGRLFLGSPYVPRTLEVPGPERLVVNLRGLDCVTFVENALALTRFSRLHGPGALEDPARARRLYEADLATLRYRDAAPDGYASRIHYFSEWLQRNDGDGRVHILSDLPGTAEDGEPIDFMSTHAEAYDQLADAETLARIREVEGALNERSPRPWVPEARIPEAASGIRTGDVIAATSTVRGLDVAHTGIAVWVDDRLHLLHAPLVGSTVVLSERPLADRIQGIGSQDGIMVARPGGSWWEAR
jgi:hypothetical protein